VTKMFEYSYSINLNVVHPSMDPKIITRALDLKPDIESRSGAELVSKRGQARMRKAVLTHWSCRLHEEPKLNSQTRPLGEYLNSCIEMLKPHQALFKRINTEGGEVQFRVGWYSDSSYTTGVLDYETLAACGSLGIGLELNMITSSE